MSASTSSSPAPGAARPTRRARLARAGLLVLFATLVGLTSFSIVTTSHLAERNDRPAKFPFLDEMTGAYAALLLLPALLAFMRRFPLERRTFWSRLPLHLVVMVVFGVTHTLLMWGSRTALYRLLGWGAYDYGDMRYRFLMEGQKQALIYWSVYAAVAVVAYARRNKERELAAARLERELTEARLAALKMQLNPHFLFNTLNMISSYVHEDPRVADAMLGHLSDFLRLTLRHSGLQEVPLSTELEFLNAYLEIMKARFEDRLTVDVDVEPETRGALVPHLVLQPLVENSVTHCTNDHEKAGRIRISAARSGARLRLGIEDDGPGLDGDAGAALSSGVGLSNTAARLKHLYGDDHRLMLENRREGGLRVLVEVPYRSS